MPAVSRPEEDSVRESETAVAGAQSNSLRRDFVWTLGGNGIYAVSQWIVIVLLAKWSGPEVVGTYSFALAVATPLITFASFQLRSVQVTDVHGEHQFSDYLGFRILSMLGAMLILAILCLALRYSLSMSALVGALGLSLAIEAVSDVFYGRMQVHNRMDSIAKSMIIRGVLSTLVMVGVVILTSNLLLAILAMVAIRALVLLFFDNRASRTLPATIRPWDIVTTPRWILPTQRVLLITAFPIGLVSVLVALNSSIPRYFIESSSGPRELGIFAALSFFQSSGNMIVGAMGQSAFGRLAANYARKEKRAFYVLLAQLVGVGVALGIAGILITAVAGKQILQVMFRHEYAARADLLTYLMVAAGLGYCCQFIGSAVTAARIFRPQVVLFAVVAASLTSFCYFLVPGHGAAGAVTAILLTTLIQIAGFVLLLVWSSRSETSRSHEFLPSTDELATVPGSAN